MEINEGDWVVYWYDSYNGKRYHSGCVSKATAKMLRLAKSSLYDRQTKRERVVAVFPTQELAAQLCQVLDGPIGEFNRRRRAADIDHNQRISAAREAMGRQVARIIASATEAGTAETVKQGSVHEGAVGKAETPNTSSSPNPSEGEG